MIKQNVGGLNPDVAKALGLMGIDAGYKEKIERSERPKVDPKVAGVLESIGMGYRSVDVAGGQIDEDLASQGTSPLDMAGEDPLVDPNQQQPGAKPAGQQVQKPANVQLKKPATQMKTLQDLSDAMTGVTKNMKTVDLIIQSLSDNDTHDNLIETHKQTLKAPIQTVIDACDRLRNLVR